VKYLSLTDICSRNVYAHNTTYIDKMECFYLPDVPSQTFQGQKLEHKMSLATYMYIIELLIYNLFLEFNNHIHVPLNETYMIQDIALDHMFCVLFKSTCVKGKYDSYAT